MVAETTEWPFAKLPAALVEEILGRTGNLGRELLQSFEAMRIRCQTHWAQLSKAGLLHCEANLGYVPTSTSCGVDDSCATAILSP